MFRLNMLIKMTEWMNVFLIVLTFKVYSNLGFCGLSFSGFLSLKSRHVYFENKGPPQGSRGESKSQTWWRTHRSGEDEGWQGGYNWYPSVYTSAPPSTWENKKKSLQIQRFLCFLYSQCCLLLWKTFCDRVLFEHIKQWQLVISVGNSHHGSVALMKHLFFFFPALF